MALLHDNCYYCNPDLLIFFNMKQRRPLFILLSILFILFAVCVESIECTAQDSDKVDSLYGELETAKEDSIKINALPVFSAPFHSLS